MNYWRLKPKVMLKNFGNLRTDNKIVYGFGCYDRILIAKLELKH